MNILKLTTEDGRQVSVTRNGDRLLVHPATTLTPEELQILKANKDVFLAIVDLPDQVQQQARVHAQLPIGPLAQNTDRNRRPNQPTSPTQNPSPKPEPEPRSTPNLQLRLDLQRSPYEPRKVSEPIHPR